MKPVADRILPTQRPSQADEAPRSQPQQQQQRFDRALQRAAQRVLGEVEDDAAAGEGASALPGPAAPWPTAVPAPRPLPPSDVRIDEPAAPAVEAGAWQAPAWPAAPALRNVVILAAPVASPPALPPTATVQALQRSALAAGAPTGHWQLLLPGQALPLRAVALQQQPGGAPVLQLHPAPGAAAPGGSAALDRLRSRLSRHALRMEFGSATNPAPRDDDFLP
ncbi:hypothetical protein [Aquincola tertiaricarbonis]|uniref:hypothetical protein n=1 Tax=Aquincola tertiaricarbonis TaxID=391953 RepID=UPI000614E508|nr:hypothetical protein [Aquincola tertiaricarbonis]